jgi:hypothetical protein
VYRGIRIRDGLRVALKQIAKSKVTEWGQVRNVPSFTALFCLLILYDECINAFCHNGVVLTANQMTDVAYL